MNSLNKLVTMITDLSDFTASINLIETFEELNKEINRLRGENTQLTENINNKKEIINTLEQKYNRDIKSREDELQQLRQDMSNLTKVSLIVSTRKELDEKNRYIKQLESQLGKSKNNDDQSNQLDSNTKIDVDEKPKKSKARLEPLPEPMLMQTNDTDLILAKELEPSLAPVNETEPEIKTKKSKSKRESKSNVDEQFNPELFEDINGFELMIYKKNYYLRELETNELYDIKDNKPNTVVGLINSSGRVKFN